MSTLRRVIGIAIATLLLGIGAIGFATWANAATGAVSGHLTDAGSPVAGAKVLLQLAVYPVTITQTTTDATGAFHLEAAPNQYKVRFELPGGLVQFYPQKTDFTPATTITVTDGGEVTIEESVVPHASIAGQITFSTGAVVPQAYIGMVKADNSPLATTIADDTGHYSFPYVPATNVKLYVNATKLSSPRQWVHGHKVSTQADTITLTAGSTTTVDEQLLPLGKIAGTFTKAGAAMSGVGITAKSTVDATEQVFASTAADGTFSLYAYPGTYKVKFSPYPYLDQWATGKESEETASVITVTANTTTTLNEQALPIGRVSGRLTDANGQPVSGSGVYVSNEALGRQFQATSDADGNWFLQAWPGTYTVEFDAPNQVQWYHNKFSPTTADTISVVADGNTVADETLAVPGSLRVAAVDAKTGAVVPSFCVTANTDFMYAFACSDDGVAEFDALGAGSYTVTITDGTHLDYKARGVVVTSGQPASHTARLKTGATVSITVTDAVTGAPVSGVCVNGRPAERAQEPNEFVGDCADSNGVVTLTRVRPDQYVFFAEPFDGQHGSQWVGPRGGVGSQAAAKVFTTRAGITTTLSVKLDGAGSIAGTVTDRVTGAPIEGATVNAIRYGATTDADGHYQLDGLGPYDWVLFTGHPSYAGQWSGGGNDRLSASTVRVRADQTTSFNVALRKGTTLTGRVTGSDGLPPSSATVSVVDAQTFDVLGTTQTAADGTYTIPVLGPQDVKLVVTGTFHVNYTTQWYRGADSFAGGRVVTVPASGTKTVDILVS